MISCSDFMAEIGNYLDGDVAQEVRARLEQHLAHCQSCTVLVDSTRKTLRVVTDAGSFELADAAFAPIASKIMSAIRETEK